MFFFYYAPLHLQHLTPDQYNYSQASETPTEKLEFFTQGHLKNIDNGYTHAAGE